MTLAPETAGSAQTQPRNLMSSFNCQPAETTFEGIITANLPAASN